MKHNLDSIIYVLNQVESFDKNCPIIYDSFGINYNGECITLTFNDKQEFTTIYESILFLKEHDLAEVRVLHPRSAIAVDRVNSKGNNFLNKASILKAIEQGKYSETEIAQVLELKQHTVNRYLEELFNEQFILAAKAFPTAKAGEREYKSCVLKTKGKEALEDPSFLMEKLNMPNNEYNFHAPVNSVNNQGSYYEQSGNFGIGHMSDGEIKGNAKVAGVINEAEEQNLAEAVAEIEALIQQLEQNNPTNTTTEQMIVAAKAIEQIESNPTWKQKAIAAVKQGGLNAIETYPIGAFVVGAIKGWLKPQTK